jgi:transposase-like protein
VRVAPTRAAEAPSPSEWDRNREAHYGDCVRIVHKHRNLMAHAPERLHEEITADYTDMIYAESAREIETRRRAFLRKWRLKCPAVAASLEEAGDRLFTFTGSVAEF